MSFWDHRRRHLAREPELPVLARVPVRAGAVREAQALGPDAAVDDPDDHVLAGVADAAGHVPQATLVAEPQEGRSGRRVQGLLLVLRHRDDVAATGELAGLGRREPGREAVEGVD